MRKFVKWAACFTAMLLTLGACTDSPTAPEQPRAADLATVEASQDQQLAGCVRDGVCVLPPVNPTVPGCDPWMSLDWCEGDGGNCMTSVPGSGEYVGIAGCEPGGGGGAPKPPKLPGSGPTICPTAATGTCPEPEPEPSDTCRTGDPALDSPAVKQGLKDLWNRSNPTAAQAQRLEQAAWIVQDPNGSYRLAPFTITRQGPCNINGNFNAPAGAVAWVHTHPFQSREIQRICGALKTPDPTAPGGFRDVIGADGQPVYPEYRNLPSIPDRELMNDINATMAQVGRPLLAGVIIDANQTTVYTENPSDGTSRFPRCAY